MLLTCQRIYHDDDTSIAILHCAGRAFFVLEDEPRRDKVVNETRIPAGVYSIKLRTDSPMANRYRKRFGDSHAGIPWLQDVPGFEYIYLHIGNDDDDTSGCLLVAETCSLSAMTVGYSTPAYEYIQAAIQEAIAHGESVSIAVIDVDGCQER